MVGAVVAYGEVGELLSGSGGLGVVEACGQVGYALQGAELRICLKQVLEGGCGAALRGFVYEYYAPEGIGEMGFHSAVGCGVEPVDGSLFQRVGRERIERASHGYVAFGKGVHLFVEGSGGAFSVLGDSDFARLDDERRASFVAYEYAGIVWVGHCAIEL